MAIAITGGTGYLGSRLARALLRSGQRVVIIGRGTTVRITRDDVGLSFRTWDDPQVLDGIDQVVHAAACYGRHGESPSAIQEANVLLPLRLLERAHQSGVRSWITVGTALSPEVSPYALSKHQFLAWAETMPARTIHTWLACEHFYGPGDDPSKFVSRCIQAFLRQEHSIALTDGTQRRDFLYIDDAVAALVYLLAQPHPPTHRRLPLGTGVAISIRDLVTTLHRLTGARTHLDFGAIPRRSGEPHESVADPVPLASLGWRSTILIEDGLARTVQMERSPTS